MDRFAAHTQYTHERTRRLPPAGSKCLPIDFVALIKILDCMNGTNFILPFLSFMHFAPNQSYSHHSLWPMRIYCIALARMPCIYFLQVQMRQAHMTGLFMLETIVLPSCNFMQPRRRSSHMIHFHYDLHFCIVERVSDALRWTEMAPSTAIDKIKNTIQKRYTSIPNFTGHARLRLCALCSDMSVNSYWHPHVFAC